MTCRQHFSFPFTTRVHFVFFTSVRLVIVLICCYVFPRIFCYTLVTIYLCQKILPSLYVGLRTPTTDFLLFNVDSHPCRTQSVGGICLCTYFGKQYPGYRINGGVLA